jgi:hypothetical protein
MAQTTRQTAIFGVEDWKQIYQTYREADFQSYDFETLRKSFIDYIRLYYPESFNDYIESSEFIALLDVIAFMGQALAFRTDLNTRENYLDTAERRDSVVRLADLVSYTAKRNTAAQGLLKVFNVATTENVVDYNGVNLSNVTVNWADPTNPDWQEQFTAIVNASLVDSQRVGRPGNRQTILGVRTEEYAINLVPGFLPVVPYSATVDGINMPFEAVTSTTVGTDIIYEPSPVAGTSFNVLFRNDQLGFNSDNTGYFFLFKQGILQNQDFNLAERIANRTVEINIEGINNDDRWIFQLDNVGNITREWTYVENVYTAAAEQETTLRPIYSTTSRANDQITVVFGDGVFSEIPVGTFRAYVRSSNGLQYIVNPEEMQNVVIPISYTDRNGNLQTITFTCGITRPVTNAQAREPIAAIKQRAPARYYTQNRMVNGEDYNLFPFTQYNSIIKSKALNRSSIGTSRYLDLVDNTGKYSSTNTFGSDGGLWEQNILPTILFSWTNRNEIADVINNQVQPALTQATVKQFYYANFPREAANTIEVVCTATTQTDNTVTVSTATSALFDQYEFDNMPVVFGTSDDGAVFGGLIGGATYFVTPGSWDPDARTFTVSTLANGGVFPLSDTVGRSVATVATTSTGGTVWNQSTSLANETTGYFKTATGVPVAVGSESGTVFRFAVNGSLIKFVAPAGQYFDRNNRLQTGIPTRTEQKIEIWASPVQVTGDGTNSGLGNFANGSGPIVLNNFVPTGAIVDTVIPLFVTDLPLSIEQQMAEQIALFRNFGLGYDNNGLVTGTPYTWYVIPSTYLDQDAPWSQVNANDPVPGGDASWMVQFVVENQNYTITFRGLAYSFGSVLQTRFFFYEDQQVFDSRTGTVIKDFINVLAMNSRPGDSLGEPLQSDIPMTIIGQPVESDGYVDDFQVLVSYRDSDLDGVPDNPDFFKEIVGTVPATANTTSPWIFLERTVDFDNLQRYLLVDSGRVISQYGTLDEIELAKTEWSPGQVFYAYSENTFYSLSITVTGVRELTEFQQDEWIARSGRQGLYYQYRHNSPLTNRIDPGTTNIIDLYVVTQAYYTAYQNWLRDTTGTVTEPQQPTIDELNTAYQGLQNYKMISDNIVLNSVTFKPLFGAKAASELRATIKVIRAQNSTASTSEIKSAVLAQMNEYFSIDKWNFGDTFYFSELAAYLHRTLGTIISSVVLVPLNPQKSFGDLYEIRSQPNEIFANGATIDNIDVIEALTSNNLRTAPGSGVI